METPNLNPLYIISALISNLESLLSQLLYLYILYILILYQTLNYAHYPGIRALQKYLVKQRNDLIKNQKEIPRAKDLKMIIDTSLLKCYLQTSPSMVASLLR